MRCITLFTALICLLAAPAVAEESRSLESVLEDLKSKDYEARLQAAKDAAALQDSKLVRLLTKLLKDDDGDIRMATIVALGGRQVASDQKRAAAALIARVPRKGGATWAEERMAIFDALHDLARPETVKPLMEAIALDMDLNEVTARVTAVANVPHADAVERLIQFLAKGKRTGGQRQQAAKALRYATGANVKGADPDVWRAWWRKAKGNFDFERAKQAREEAEKAAARAAREKRDKQAEKERRRKKKREGRKKKKDEKPKDDA